MGLGVGQLQPPVKDTFKVTLISVTPPGDLRLSASLSEALIPRLCTETLQVEADLLFSPKPPITPPSPTSVL